MRSLLSTRRSDEDLRTQCLLVHAASVGKARVKLRPGLDVWGSVRLQFLHDG